MVGKVAAAVGMILQKEEGTLMIGVEESLEEVRIEGALEEEHHLHHQILKYLPHLLHLIHHIQ